jgi:hypothetical protein
MHQCDGESKEEARSRVARDLLVGETVPVIAVTVGADVDAVQNVCS